MVKLLRMELVNFQSYLGALEYDDAADLIVNYLQLDYDQFKGVVKHGAGVRYMDNRYY